jgi:hypothetical protein
MSTDTPAGDHPKLEHLEYTVRTELLLAEGGQKESHAGNGPTAEQPPDPDAERYQADLGALLGAVRALEQKSCPGDLSSQGE